MDTFEVRGAVVGDDGVVRTPWGHGSGRHAALMRDYYDTEWGLPVTDERGLFERLTLEAFQSGLSWETVLRKRPAFRAAFDDFDPDAVAGYDDTDVARLLADAGIVRNRAKIRAAVVNARATVALRPDGGLPRLVWSHRPERTPVPWTAEEVPTRSPESLALSRDLKARGFTFVGPTTMYALMEAAGVVDTHLLGSHRRGCSGLWRPDGTRAADPTLPTPRNS